MNKEKLYKYANHFNNLIIKVTEFLLFLAIVSFVISINTGIIGRLLKFPVTFVEDFCRFVQVWVTMLGLSCAVHSHTVPAVELLIRNIPLKAQRILNHSVDSIIILISIALIYSSSSLISLMGDMTIASMDMFTMKYFYAALPVGGIMISFFSVQRIIFRLLGVDIDKSYTTSEE